MNQISEIFKESLNGVAIQGNQTISTIWDIFKKGCLAVDPDNREEEVDLYYINLETSENDLLISFYFHLIKDEQGNQIDENHSISCEFVIPDNKSSDELHEFEDYLNNCFSNIENLDIYNDLKNQNVEYKIEI